MHRDRTVSDDNIMSADVTEVWKNSNMLCSTVQPLAEMNQTKLNLGSYTKGAFTKEIDNS